MKKILTVFLMTAALSLPCFADQYKVLRVIDGDTIDVDYKGKTERIRFLNVDTPESVHPDKTRNTWLGKQAAGYTEKRLAGKSVTLEFEGKKRGKYGRLLAFVFLDNKNFNLELVQKGWSPYYIKYGASKRYHPLFTLAQSHARTKGLNIWKSPVLKTHGNPITPSGSHLAIPLAQARVCPSSAAALVATGDFVPAA